MSTPNKNNGVSNAASNSTRSTSGNTNSYNVQSIISSIRSIAKTKELEQKVEKLIQGQKPTALPGLNAERIIAQQAALSGGAISASSKSARDENKDPGSITDTEGETVDDALYVLEDNTQPASEKSSDKSDLDTSSNGFSSTDISKGIYRIGDLFTDQAPYPTENGDSKVPRIKGLAGSIDGKDVSVLLRELSPYDNVPDGWDDADHPPVESGWEYWEQGYWYSAEGTFVTGTRGGGTKYLAALAITSAAVGFIHPSFGYTVEAYRNLTNVGSNTASGDYLVEYYLNWDATATPINTGWIGSTIIVDKLGCGLGDPDEGDNCPVSAPRLTEFPLGGILGFGWRDGKWEFHLYDSEGSLIVQDKKSVLMMDDGGNGYELGPKRGGGWYAAPTFITPGTAPAILIRPNGTVQGYIDKNLLPYYTGSNTQTQNDNGFIGVPHLI